MTAYDVAVTDDVLGPIPCPTTTLAPGESMICTAPTQPAIAGQQTNLATVIAAPTLGEPPAAMAEGRAYNFGRTRPPLGSGW